MYIVLLHSSLLIFTYFQLKRFAKSKYGDLGIATRALQQSIEHGEANIEWMERNFDKIVRWLRKTTR